MHALPPTEILDWMLDALRVACEACGGVHPLQVNMHRKPRNASKARSVWGQLVRRHVRTVGGMYQIRFGDDVGKPISFPVIADITGTHHTAWLLSIRHGEYEPDVQRCEVILERQHIGNAHAEETKLRWLDAEG